MDMKQVMEAAGLAASEETEEKLSRYHALLMEWNQKMDLTSVSEQDMAVRHFLDSLLPLREKGLFPENAALIDVGTGAGFPGLPLAIARPDLKVTLLEAQGKRCTFLQAVVDELGLQNVTILNDRAENAGRDAKLREAFDLAAARAVAPLPVLCEYLLPFVKKGGRMLCWKGPAVLREMADGTFAAKQLGAELHEPMEMRLPGEESGHVLVTARKTKETPPQYPRKNGIPAKRPLKSGK